MVAALTWLRQESLRVKKLGEQNFLTSVMAQALLQPVTVGLRNGAENPFTKQPLATGIKRGMNNDNGKIYSSWTRR